MGRLWSGSYKPSIGASKNGCGTVPSSFPSPAPAGPYPLSLSVFNGTNPNGNWKLYVVDDNSSDSGSISAGWTIHITTVGNELSALQAAATEAAPKSDLGKKVSKIQKYVAANNIAGACAGLADFINSANAQAGKKGLTKSEAADSYPKRKTIESTLGC